MPNTINIVQPKAEDGTEISFITHTNSIFKSDGSPLGDSMDAYMDEVDELSQNLADLDYGTASVITPTQVNDYFTAPSMGVVRGYIRKSNTQNAGTFGFKSSITGEYVYINNITVVDGYVPVEYLMCRGETITFATINELSLSGSKLRFFPLKKRT